MDGLGEYFAGIILIWICVALVVGAGVGIALFEGIPWLWHHISFTWS